MDAIDKAVATYRVALAERDAAEVKLGAAKADLVSALGLGTAADFSPSNEVAKAAVARPVKPPAKPAPKPKPPAAPAPKAAPKPAPAASRDAEAKPRGVWTEQAARLLWPALTPEWQARFRKLLVGPLPVAKLFPGESRPGPLFAGLTWKSRSATHINSSPVITEDGTARLADGLDVALRAAGIVP